MKSYLISFDDCYEDLIDKDYEDYLNAPREKGDFNMPYETWQHVRNQLSGVYAMYDNYIASNKLLESDRMLPEMLKLETLLRY